MTIRNIAIITILVCFSTSSMASSNNWVKLNENTFGSLYAMPKSISEDEFGNKLIWLKAINNEPLKNVKSFKSLYVFDCDAKKLGISHSIEYDDKGNTISEKSISSVLAPVHTADPDGFSYKLMQSMCR